MWVSVPRVPSEGRAARTQLLRGETTMIPKPRALFVHLWRRMRSHVPMRMVFALAAACVAVLVVFVGGRVGLAAACLFLFGGITWAGRSVVLLRREEHEGAAARRPRQRATADDRYVQRLRRHLWGGFSTTALDELREFSSEPTRTPASRASALSAVCGVSCGGVRARPGWVSVASSRRSRRARRSPGRRLCRRRRSGTPRSVRTAGPRPCATPPYCPIPGPRATPSRRHHCPRGRP